MTYSRIFTFLIGCFLLVMQGCNKQQVRQDTMAIEFVEQAKQAIVQYQGKTVDFVLPIPQDKALTLHGSDVSREVAMAIITDCILEKGWLPDSFDEKGQVRYYKYSQ